MHIDLDKRSFFAIFPIIQNQGLQIDAHNQLSSDFGDPLTLLQDSSSTTVQDLRSMWLDTKNKNADVIKAETSVTTVEGQVATIVEAIVISLNSTHKNLANFPSMISNETEQYSL